LDALDECVQVENSRRNLLSWMKDMHASNLKRANVHLLATSRPEQDIQNALRKWSSTTDWIEIQSDLISEDIRKYVTKGFNEIGGTNFEFMEEKTRNEILNKLLKKAQGMLV